MDVVVTEPVLLVKSKPYCFMTPTSGLYLTGKPVDRPDKKTRLNVQRPRWMDESIGGYRVSGLIQINTCREVPLPINFFRWRHFALVPIYLISQWTSQYPLVIRQPWYTEGFLTEVLAAGEDDPWIADKDTGGPSPNGLSINIYIHDVRSHSFLLVLNTRVNQWGFRLTYIIHIVYIRVILNLHSLRLILQLFLISNFPSYGCTLCVLYWAFVHSEPHFSWRNVYILVTFIKRTSIVK